jgi:hypothetical protein
MTDYLQYPQRFFEQSGFTAKCKRIVSILAVFAAVFCVLLLFSPLNGFVTGALARIKPLTNTTWRAVIGSFGVFGLLLCVFALYGIHSKKLNDSTQIKLLTACIAGILAATTYMAYRYGRQWLDSDMASEMILGDLLAKENRMVTSSWVYSTELRLVYQQLFYMPLFKLFEEWRVVRTITTLLNLIVLLASYFFMMKQFAVSKKTALLTSIFLILPVSYVYWNIVLFGGYYVFFIAMFFCYLGLCAILLDSGGQSKIKKRNAAFVFFALLSVIFGAGGVRSLMDIQVPLFITAIGAYFFRKEVRLVSKPVLISAAGLALCAAGYAVNFLLHIFYRFHSHHGAATTDLSGVFAQKLGDFLYSFILFLGFTPNAKFMTPQGLLSFASIIVCFLIFYEAARIIKTRPDSNVSVICVYFMLFYAVSTAYHIALFQFLEEDLISQHLIPTQILYIPALAVIFEFVKKSMSERKAALFLSGIVFTILCTGMMRLYSLPEYDRTTYRMEAISYLEKNDLRFGFASFWNANVITELTNGRIEILGLHYDDYHRIHVWLYPVAYEDPAYYAGETFLMLTQDEWKNIHDEKLSGRQPDYEDEYFVIFRYPSAVQVFDEVITGG